jgi:hypothetical protein
LKSFSWKNTQLGPGMTPATAASNSLNNLEFLSPVDLITREPFQNSKDERIEGNKLKFQIRLHILTGEQKNKFVDLMDVAEIQRIAPLFDDRENYFRDGQEELKKIHDPDYSIKVLEISDNASGLGGDWSRPGDDANFYNLVLSLYNSRKPSAEKETLGSYGVGKMVFALASKLRFMMYYSHFLESDKTNGAWARFMATGFFNQFEENGKDYSGYSYFGKPTELEQHMRQPLENEEADSFVSELGFRTKNFGETGTSIFVPFVTADDIYELKSSFEKWWWPVFESTNFQSEYDISFVDSDGEEIKLNPLKNPNLRPMIKAFNNLNANANTDDGQVGKISAQRDGKLTNAGTLSLLKIGDKGDDNPLVNKVAWVRGGMVVKYDDRALEADPELGCVGVFQATKDKVFKLSEPPAHDNWIANDQRLERIEGKEAGSFLRRALNRLNTMGSDFKKKHKEFSRPKQHNPLSFLDDTLMPLLKSSKSGKSDHPEVTPRAAIIHKKGLRKEINGEWYDQLEFGLSISDEFHEDELDYEVQITLHAAEGSNAKKIGEKLAINVDCDAVDNNLINKGQFVVALEKGHFVTGTANAAVNRNWITRWTVQLQPAGEIK